MLPVSRKLPSPFFFVLNCGYPSFPVHLPCFFRAHRRKKWVKAASKFHRASCGAHLETSYIQGTWVFLRALSSRCSSIAVGLFLDARYRSCLTRSPQLYAQRAAPACWRQPVTCRSVKSSSV